MGPVCLINHRSSGRKTNSARCPANDSRRSIFILGNCSLVTTTAADRSIDGTGNQPSARVLCGEGTEGIRRFRSFIWALVANAESSLSRSRGLIQCRARPGINSR